MVRPGQISPGRIAGSYFIQTTVKYLESELASKGQKLDWNRAVQDKDAGAGPFTTAGGPASEVTTAAEMSSVLEGFVSSPELGNNYRGFRSLVTGVRRVMKVNPHQHITGSVGDGDLLRRVVQIYREDTAVGDRFLDYISSIGMIKSSEREGFFNQTDADLVRWLEARLSIGHNPGEFPECDRHLDMARLAFQSLHPEATELFRQAYRRVALENLADGVSEVWFRTTLGDHADGRYARAALEGARDAERDSEGGLKVRFLAGTRKLLDGTQQSPSTTSINALSLLQQNSDDRSMVLGIDSVGVESDWKPEQQASLRDDAAAHSLRVAVHFAESWKVGALPEILERLKELVTYGVIDHLDNANGLFAVPDENPPVSHYSPQDWKIMADLQLQIVQVLVQRRITLGINPTSNDMLTRALRRKEGWRFRKFDEQQGEGLPSLLDMMSCEEESDERLRVILGNDNSRIYSSRIDGAYLTVSEELASLWSMPGRSNGSIFGQLPTTGIARLILNGLELAKTVDSESSAMPAELGG